MSNKRSRKHWPSSRKALSLVQLPEDVDQFLSEKERALLKYLFAGMNVKDLRRVYRCKDIQLRDTLLINILILGYKLAEITILETKIFPDWAKTNKSGYLDGFLDCKHQVKGVIKNGIRKESGRKTQ